METLRSMLLSDAVDLFLSCLSRWFSPLAHAALVTIVLCIGHVKRSCMFAASVAVVVVEEEEEEENGLMDPWLGRSIIIIHHRL